MDNRKQQISKLRYKLVRIAKKKNGNLLQDDVQKASKELDRMIVRYMCEQENNKEK